MWMTCTGVAHRALVPMPAQGGRSKKRKGAKEPSGRGAGRGAPKRKRGEGSGEDSGEEERGLGRAEAGRRGERKRKRGVAEEEEDYEYNGMVGAEEGGSEEDDDNDGVCMDPDDEDWAEGRRGGGGQSRRSGLRQRSRRQEYEVRGEWRGERAGTKRAEGRGNEIDGIFLAGDVEHNKFYQGVSQDLRLAADKREEVGKEEGQDDIRGRRGHRERRGGRRGERARGRGETRTDARAPSEEGKRELGRAMGGKR